MADSVLVEVDNTTEFYRHHSRVRATCGDTTITWSIPDRLLMNIDLSALIIRELLEAMNDKLALSNRSRNQRPASA